MKKIPFSSATELIGGEGGKFPEAPGETLTYKNAVTAGGIHGDVIAFINGYFVLMSAAANGEEAWFEQTQTVVFTAGPFKGSSLTIVGKTSLTRFCLRLRLCFTPFLEPFKSVFLTSIRAVKVLRLRFGSAY